MDCEILSERVGIAVTDADGAFQGTANAGNDRAHFLRGGLGLRHMSLIVALDDHGRVGAAAQVMNMSQPAASRMIADMEAQLDVRLCDRLPRGIMLTPYGKALARRARSILLEMREARTLVNARADYALPDMGLTVSVWATNLFDEEYQIPNIDLTANFGLLGGITQEPRMYGLTIRKTFGAE